MATDRFQSRRNRLVRKLRKTNADVMLVTYEPNVTYLTGFSGDSSYLLLAKDLAVMVSDSRYTTQIQEECPGLEARIRKTAETILDTALKLARKQKIKKLAVEADTLAVSLWQRLGEQIPLQPTSGLVEELRMVKDADEIAEIRRAIDQAERGFGFLQAGLQDTMTELNVAHDLEHAMRRFGAEKAAFEIIAAVGDRAALPHARPGRRPVSSAEFLLIDWGAHSLGGYKSDLTRMLVTGKILPKLKKLYEVVLKAQEAGIAAIGPGVASRDVDRAARSVIERAGYGKQFGHGLGHGFGLEIHEHPRLSPVTKTRLSPGMVITIEPGIYLPGWGGIRIEDDVLVTRDGCEVLTSLPKQFADSVLR